jgi:dihydrofolate synthase/folylpolyglutamate synthase
MTAQQLTTRLAVCGITAPQTHDDVASACRAGQQAAGTGGRVLVFGSFHTVEQALRSGVLPAGGHAATL